MGLLSTAAIIAVLVILIAAVFFVLYTPIGAAAKITASKAQGLVVNDIKTQNPNANITVLSVSNSTLSANSYQIAAGIIYNGSKPCPTVMIDVFDYPALGLQPYTANLYTKGCAINGLSQAPSYVISMPQIAIARSYAANDTQIRDYVSKFGYGNTFVSAKFIGAGSTNSTVFGNETNVWLVKYTATNAAYNLYAVLGQSGMIVQTYNTSN